MRVLLLCCTLLLASCSNGESAVAPTPPPRPVRVALPEAGPSAPPVEATGIVAFRDETRLSFLVPGVIRDMTVREGDTVKAGQVLATLETTQVDAGATQAREAWMKAQRDLARGRQLYRDEVLTREQLEDLETAEKVARAALDAAEFNRGHAQIVAPAEGQILRRLAEAREAVAAGQPVLTFGTASSGLVLRLGLSDRDVVRVQVGDPAELHFDAFPQQSFTGHVQELSQASDPRSGTYRVDVAFESNTARFVSGLIGRARIQSTALTGASTLQYIPLTALVEGTQEQALVFLLPKGASTVKATRVALAFVDGGRIALRQPLPEGARVVTEGAAYLQDGDAVEVVETKS